MKRPAGKTVIDFTKPDDKVNKKLLSKVVYYKAKIPIPTMYYDHRETIPKKGKESHNMKMKKFFLERYGLVKSNNMICGDYACGNFVFELKEVDDFLQSMINGRLKKQIATIQDNNMEGRLIVRANSPDEIFAASEGRISESSVHGFLASLQEIGWFPTFFYKWKQIFEHMVRTWEKHHDGKDHAQPDPHKVVYKDPDIAAVVGMCGVSIGKQRAEAIIDYFGGKGYFTVNELANCTYEQLIDIEGIGADMARGIYKRIYKEEPPIVQVMNLTGVGQKTSENILKYIDGNVWRLRDMSVKELLEINGVGQKLANMIHEKLNSKEDSFYEYM